MITAYSFDVFDTCLTRKVALPHGVFYEVALKVFAKRGLSASSCLVEDFVASRINAEETARKQSVCEDVTLDEIWRRLCPRMGWQYEESLSRCELDAEAESICPIVAAREQVLSARRKNARIIFVSDMYLPSDFIRQQLHKHGFAEPGDPIYVSGELGKTKASGNLFRHLLTEENLRPSNLLHAGDNRRTDFDVPRKLGIRTGLCEFSKPTCAERSVLQINPGSAPLMRIAGAMRAHRLAHSSERNGSVSDLVSQFIGPFCVSFAAWVLQRAQEKGIKRLYFLSRDCQLVWKVACKLSPHFGNIDCRYLYASRQALFLPSAVRISPEEMPWMKRTFEKPVLGRLLAKVNLQYADVASSFESLTQGQGESYALKSEKDWADFWTLLNREPAKTRIDAAIVTQRDAARRYFQSAGLLDEVPWALVDFGWRLGCQSSLRKLLKLWGWQGDICGYYLGLKNARAGFAEAGRSEAMVYETSPAPFETSDVATAFSHELILESIVGCADHPTVHHYGQVETGGFGPVFATSMDNATLRLSRDLSAELLEFADRNYALLDDLSNPEICRIVLVSLMAAFFNSPTEEAVSPIRGLSAAVDQNSLDPMAVVKPLNLGTALLPLLPKRRPFKALWKERCFWLEGAIAITPAPVRRISRCAQALAELRARIHRTFSPGLTPS